MNNNINIENKKVRFANKVDVVKDQKRELKRELNREPIKKQPKLVPVGRRVVGNFANLDNGTLFDLSPDENERDCRSLPWRDSH